jgi:hypothetical protein
LTIEGAAIGTLHPFFNYRGSGMDDNSDFEGITEELLEEFKKFGSDYPLITKMFMDMVAVIADHNSRLDSLASLGENTIGDLEKIYMALKDHEKKLNILKNNIIEDDVTQFLHTGFRRRKKDVLN